MNCFQLPTFAFNFKVRRFSKAADAGDKDACLDLALCMYSAGGYTRPLFA